jgi:hypothetical protein
MEISEFEDFIRLNYTQDTAQCLTDIISTVQGFNLTDNLHDLMNILMQDQLVNKVDLVDEFRVKLEQICLSLLTSHGITISEDSTLIQLSEVTKALLELPFYTDPAFIKDALQTSLDVKTKFVDVLALVCTLQEDELFLIIDDVDVNLLDRLFELTNDSVDITSNELNDKIINKLKQLKQFLSNELPEVFTDIENGKLLGSTFDSYFDLIEKDESISAYKIAKNVFVVLTMSRDGFDNPIATYKKHSDHLFVSLDTITKVDVQLVRLIQEFDKHVLTNRNKNG